MTQDNLMDLVRFLGERSGEGVVLFDEGGRVVTLNATARRLLKLWRQEDEPLLPVVCGRLGLRPNEIFTLQGAGVPWCANLFGKLVEVHLYGFAARKGMQASTMALLRDIEREKEIEQARNEFLVLLGQELRNPIEALRGVVGTLREGLLGDVSGPQREFLDVIELQMDGVAEFVGSLLDFSSVLVGGYRYRRTPVVIGDVAQKVKIRVEGIARQRGVRFTMKGGRDVPHFYGDEERLQHGLTALAAGAVRMRPKGGAVELAIGTDSETRSGNPVPGGALLLTVRTGNIGIPKAAADHVLARPAATEMAAARECGGFGLALLVAKSVVVGHGGKVWTEGKGGLLHSVHMLIPMDLRRGRVKGTKEAAHDGPPPGGARG